MGILHFSGYVLFAPVTLPVEFNASSRPVHVFQGVGVVRPREAEGVRAVLNAAALTCVAAAAMAVLRLARLLALRDLQEE